MVILQRRSLIDHEEPEGPESGRCGERSTCDPSIGGEQVIRT